MSLQPRQPRNARKSEITPLKRPIAAMVVDCPMCGGAFEVSLRATGESRRVGNDVFITIEPVFNHTCKTPDETPEMRAA